MRDSWERHGETRCGPSVDFLRSNGQTLQLASYDRRLLVAARGMRFPILSL
ncbi:MAG TPA: hypothetical protein VMR23_12040 [Candidatus Limnocylindria bacterium]|nr:hypothetical protein [Candidatus Limnocylindria bacterium]